MQFARCQRQALALLGVGDHAHEHPPPNDGIFLMPFTVSGERSAPEAIKACLWGGRIGWSVATENPCNIPLAIALLDRCAIDVPRCHNDRGFPSGCFSITKVLRDKADGEHWAVIT